MPSESVVLLKASKSLAIAAGPGLWLELLNVNPRGDSESGSPRVHMTADSALPGGTGH